MNKSGVIRQGNPWRVLNRDQMKIIDNAAYEILREVGLSIADGELLKMTKELGAEIDSDKKIAKGFPEYHIRDNVAKCPRNFVLGARDPDWDMIFQGGGRKQFYVPSCGATERLVLNPDKKTFKRRRVNKDDLAYVTRIADGVDDFDGNNYIFDLGEEGQQGLPTEIIKLDTMLKNSSKWAGNMTTVVQDIKEHDHMAKMGALVQGGEDEHRKRPLYFNPLNPLGTLQMNLYNSWALRASFKNHIPESTGVVSGAPLVGPATTAANAAVAHAGLLWVAAMKGHFDPGTAVISNNIVFALDPYTGRGTLASAHSVFGSNVTTGLWHDFYSLPVAQYSGTPAAVIDQMTAILMASMVLQMLDGTDLQWLQFADAALDPAMIMPAAEIAHFCRHLMTQFDQTLPTKENLALDLIKEVGATGEGWMNSDFNMNRIDKFYRTLTMDERGFDVWLREGAPLWTHDTCREKLKEYEKHEPAPMPKDLYEKLDTMTKEGIELFKKTEGGAFHGASPV